MLLRCRVQLLQGFEEFYEHASNLSQECDEFSSVSFSAPYHPIASHAVADAGSDCAQVERLLQAQSAGMGDMEAAFAAMLDGMGEYA